MLIDNYVFLLIETIVDEQTQQNFIICLCSLRLLAKVLGLLISLPYRSESNNFKELIATQVEIRTKVSNILMFYDFMLYITNV